MYALAMWTAAMSFVGAGIGFLLANRKCPSHKKKTSRRRL